MDNYQNKLTRVLLLMPRRTCRIKAVGPIIGNFDGSDESTHR
jgi:hypothetical protein